MSKKITLSIVNRGKAEPVMQGPCLIEIDCDELEALRQRAEQAEALLREFTEQLAQDFTCRWCGTHTDQHNAQCLMDRAKRHCNQ